MTADLHTLAGAYALNALSPDEERAFAIHVKQCAACAGEVSEFRETAVRLAQAVAERPPPAMRDRVMAMIPETRQLPPIGRDAEVIPLRSRTWRQRMPYLAAAACLVGAAVAGGVAINAEHQADAVRSSTQQQASAAAAVLAAPDASFHTTAVHGGGQATVVTSRSLDRTAIVYHDLPTLSDARVYQLWYSRGGTMHSAGLLRTGHNGTMVLTGDAHGSSAVGLTAEPHGGSKQPTTSPLMLVSIPA